MKLFIYGIDIRKREVSIFLGGLDTHAITFFLKESVTIFRVHAIVQLVMIAATPIPTTRGQLCLAIDKIFFLP